MEEDVRIAALGVALEFHDLGKGLKGKKGASDWGKARGAGIMKDAREIVKTVREGSLNEVLKSVAKAGDETWQHPELREGEVCLGNIEKNVFYKVYRRWNPKRMGKVAYDIHGNKISQGKNTSKYVPIFVSQAEVKRRELRADRYGSRKRHKKEKREEKRKKRQ